MLYVPGAVFIPFCFTMLRRHFLLKVPTFLSIARWLRVALLLEEVLARLAIEQKLAESWHGGEAWVVSCLDVSFRKLQRRSTSKRSSNFAGGTNLSLALSEEYVRLLLRLFGCCCLVCLFILDAVL